MPVTTLDPRAALIVLDLQEGIRAYAQGDAAAAAAAVFQTAGTLTAAFRRHGLPVILYDHRSAGAQAYVSLAAELLKRERKARKSAA